MVALGDLVLGISTCLLKVEIQCLSSLASLPWELSETRQPVFLYKKYFQRVFSDRSFLSLLQLFSPMLNIRVVSTLHLP
jgi:hypothetical protein